MHDYSAAVALFSTAAALSAFPAVAVGHFRTAYVLLGLSAALLIAAIAARIA